MVCENDDLYRDHDQYRGESESVRPVACKVFGEVTAGETACSVSCGDKNFVESH